MYARFLSPLPIYDGMPFPSPAIAVLHDDDDDGDHDDDDFLPERSRVQYPLLTVSNTHIHIPTYLMPTTPCEQPADPPSSPKAEVRSGSTSVKLQTLEPN